MERIVLDIDSMAILENGPHEAEVDLFAIRIWADEALGDGAPSESYLEAMREMLAERCPSLNPESLSLGQLMVIHNRMVDRTDELLELQKKSNGQTVESRHSSGESTRPNGDGHASGPGSPTSHESLPSGV